jgi:hypothetical protein
MNISRGRGGVTVLLQLGATSDVFAGQLVRVSFDNFSAEAEDVFCPFGVPVPPRKR